MNEVFKNNEIALKLSVLTETPHINEILAQIRYSSSLCIINLQLRYQEIEV